MCVRFYQGEPMEKTLAWAEGELEGLCAAKRSASPRHVRVQAAAMPPAFMSTRSGSRRDAGFSTDR